MNRQINVVQLFSSLLYDSDKQVASARVCANEFDLACQTSQSIDNTKITETS